MANYPYRRTMYQKTGKSPTARKTDKCTRLRKYSMIIENRYYNNYGYGMT